MSYNLNILLMFKE